MWRVFACIQIMAISWSSYAHNLLSIITDYKETQLKDLKELFMLIFPSQVLTLWSVVSSIASAHNYHVSVSHVAGTINFLPLCAFSILIKITKRLKLIIAR